MYCVSLGAVCFKSDFIATIYIRHAIFTNEEGRLAKYEPAVINVSMRL